MPIAFELAPPNAPERVVAAETLERVDLAGYTVMADKASPATSSKSTWPAWARVSSGPTAATNRHPTGSLGPVRQWIESVIWTCKGQLTLEAHGGRTIEGLCARIALRLLALAVGLIHNHNIGDPGRHFAACDH